MHAAVGHTFASVPSIASMGCTWLSAWLSAVAKRESIAAGKEDGASRCAGRLKGTEWVLYTDVYRWASLSMETDQLRFSPSNLGTYLINAVFSLVYSNSRHLYQILMTKSCNFYLSTSVKFVLRLACCSGLMWLRRAPVRLATW
jgi:hypothetical protein